MYIASLICCRFLLLLLYIIVLSISMFLTSNNASITYENYIQKTIVFLWAIAFLADLEVHLGTVAQQWDPKHCGRSPKS